jgi:molybdate transport system substrate-binding protein
MAGAPGVRVDLSYKGSGYFLPELVRTGEGDLFMPGEEYYVLQAVERKLVASYDPARDVAARFITVILVPRGNPAGVRGLADFARPGVKVGLGDAAACAVGVWHEKLLARAGLLDAVRANAVMMAKCIPELGNAAQHRAIDATVVWASTAVLYLRDCEVIPLEPRLRGCIRLPVVRLAGARRPELAERLRDFLLSDEGRRGFESHAYCVRDVPTDAEGFCLDASTDREMGWLVAAARACKEEGPVDEASVGPLLGEVRRQLETVRAGN